MTVIDEWAAANPRSLALHERARRVITTLPLASVRVPSS